VPTPQAGEKIDIRKYLLVLRRRMWWGIVPFLLLATGFAVVTMAVPPRFMSSCLIRASKSEEARIYEGGSSDRGATRAARTVATEEMLEFAAVMKALADTEVMKDVDRRVEQDPSLRGALEEKLHREIKKHTTVLSIGGKNSPLMRITHLSTDPGEAQEVLDKLTHHFVEHALDQKSEAARGARKRAEDELRSARGALEGVENQLVTFREQHPGVPVQGEGGKRGSLEELSRTLREFDRGLRGKRGKLDRYLEQLESMPKQVIDEVRTRPNPEVDVYKRRLAELRNDLAMSLKAFTPLHPRVKELEQQIQVTEELLAEAQALGGEDEVTVKRNVVREQLEEKKLELEAELDALAEVHADLRQRERVLTEGVQALPGLQKELTRLLREKSLSTNRYEGALAKFRRLDENFRITMEGLVSFQIVTAARRPHKPNVRHKLKLALTGLFASFAAAIAAIAGAEFLDQTFPDVETARDVLRLPSLGVIPYIGTDRERRRRLIRYLVVIGGIVLLALVAFGVGRYVPVANAAFDRLWDLIKELCKNLV